jgi:polysaccharide biosynthesis transport protein
MYTTLDREAPDAGTTPGAKAERTDPRRSERPRTGAPAARPTLAPADLGELWRFDLMRTLGWIGQRFWWVVAAVVAGAIVAFFVVSVIPPRFTASAELLVDPSNLKVMPNDLFTDTQQRDSALLDSESKLRVLTSGNVLAQVVDKLKLQDDPDFAGQAGSGFSLGALFGSSSGARQVDPRLAAQQALAKRVTAERDPTSFVATVSVWSGSPDKSVAIAQALIDAFQAELARQQSDDAAHAAATLTDRLDSLKADAAAADDAVQQFKRAHGLQTSSGELVSTLLNNQVDTQLLAARNAVIQAQARYDQLAASQATATAAGSLLQSNTMTALRTQYSLIDQQLQSAIATLGPRHPTRLALEAQKAALEQQIHAEAVRLVGTAKEDLKTAQASVKSLQQESATAKATVFSDNDAQVQLRALQRDSDAKAAIYQTFLARAGQIAERQQIDTTNVRVISPPLPPETRSFPPRTLLVVIAGAVLGMLFGALAAVAAGLAASVRRFRRTGALA